MKNFKIINATSTPTKKEIWVLDYYKEYTLCIFKKENEIWNCYGHINSPNYVLICSDKNLKICKNKSFEFYSTLK